MPKSGVIADSGPSGASKGDDEPCGCRISNCATNVVYCCGRQENRDPSRPQTGTRLPVASCLLNMTHAAPQGALAWETSSREMSTKLTQRYMETNTMTFEAA